MISSYTSHKKLQLRGGVPVGEQSLQHILDFAAAVELKPTSGDHEACCIQCVINDQKIEAFFAIVLSTRRLLSGLDSSRPIETDETFKVIYVEYEDSHWAKRYEQSRACEVN